MSDCLLSKFSIFLYILSFLKKKESAVISTTQLKEAIYNNGYWKYNNFSFLFFFRSRILLNCDEVFRNFRPTKNFGVLRCGKRLSALLMKLYTRWFEQQGAEGYQNVFANSMIQGKQMERKCLPLCERARDPCFSFFSPHVSVFGFLCSLLI